MTTTILLNLLAFGILFSSAMSITSNNPVISIIFLITAFVNAAGYLILLGINFIGLSYIVIYVGAIAVLFLFIILMINIKLADILDSGNSYTKNLPIGLNIASLFLFIVISLLIQDKNITHLLNSSPSPFRGWGGDFLIKDSFSLNLFNQIEGKYGWIFNNYPNELNISNFVQIEVLGHSLYIYSSILLIVLSLILLLSMLAIIVISKSNNKNI